MLQELNISDLAIIDNIEISLGRGLNVFTGETGAGKSIIIGAIDLVLGDRASSEFVRTSAEEARVEAAFDIKGVDGLEKSFFEESGIPRYDKMLVRRVIQKSGRSKVFVNDSLSTIVTLSEIGRRLIDIYGQSEHQSLTRVEEHVLLLDAFGNNTSLCNEMRDTYARYLAVKREFDALSASAKKDSSDLELLSFQSKEIGAAALKAGEEEELRKAREVLLSAERLISVSGGAEGALYSGSQSIIGALGSIQKSIKAAVKLDEKLSTVADRLEASIIELEDCAAFLRDYSSGIEANPQKLEDTEARLALIEKLRKKYGATIKDVLERKEEIDRRLGGFDDYEERLKELRAESDRLREEASMIAESLTEARIRIAGELKVAMEKELSELGMKGCVFEAVINIERNQDGTLRLTETGADRVTFMMSTNKGEEIKPLSKIASGGELSRIMLAIKSITSVGKVPTLIFDEVDTGVGAAMAQVVGKKLRSIAKGHQVICITHMPQIAVYADAHYYVHKITKDKRTVTRVKKLDGEERVEQIARMFEGGKPTEAMLAHARELLKDAARK